MLFSELGQSSELESVKVTVYALGYCTPFGATRQLTDYPLQTADHPSDIGQESGCGHGFVVEFSFTCQSCRQQQLLSGASIRYGYYIFSQQLCNQQH